MNTIIVIFGGLICIQVIIGVQHNSKLCAGDIGVTCFCADIPHFKKKVTCYATAVIFRLPTFGYSMKTSTTMLVLHGPYYRITVSQILAAWPSLKLLSVEGSNIQCTKSVIEEVGKVGVQLFCFQTPEYGQSTLSHDDTVGVVKSSSFAPSTTIITTLSPTTITEKAWIDHWDKLGTTAVTRKPTIAATRKPGMWAGEIKHDSKKTVTGGAIVGLSVGLSIAVGIILGAVVFVGICWWKRRRRDHMYFSSPIYNDPVLAMNSIDNEDISL